MIEKEYKSWIIGETKAKHGVRDESVSKRVRASVDKKESLPTPERSAERQVNA